MRKVEQLQALLRIGLALLGVEGLQRVDPAYALGEERLRPHFVLPWLD